MIAALRRISHLRTQHKNLDRDEILRRLRLGHVRKLLLHRYGPELPDDDAGRADLRELLLPISLGQEPHQKMRNAIDVQAPWMGDDEATALIDEIRCLPLFERKPTPKVLGALPAYERRAGAS
jgi:hypothetical protein